jgi:putative molybdopterin biosynthesis protein
MEPISYADSLKLLQQIAAKLHATTERIPVREASSRVLSSPVTAMNANPRAPVAAMDGIAVNCMSIPDALVRLRHDQWRSINTGEVLPATFNAVVKIEDVQWEEKIPVLDRKPNLYQNVRLPGEDFEKGTLLLTPEHLLQPQDISLLLSSGCDQVEVYKRPSISFIPTGSELVNSYDPDHTEQVLESNSAMVAGLVQKWGGQCRLLDSVPDEADDLAQMVKVCVQQSDIVVISAGTSKGTRDLTAEVIGYMGQIHFHGVHLTPGKPVLLGEISGIPIIGLPGYPAAAYICSYLYLLPLVTKLSHLSAVAFPKMVFISAEDISQKAADSFYRVNCFDVDGQIFVRRIAGGASSIASLSRMDGLMHVPPQTVIRKRDGVRVDVVHERAQNTITVRGVSDPVLHHLFDLVGKSMPSHRFLFWNAAASDALQTIIERSLHIATIGVPVHGIDPFDSFGKQLQEPMHRYRAFTRSVTLVFRQDGIQELTKDANIAVADSNLSLWHDFLDHKAWKRQDFHTITPAINDTGLIDALPSSKWDAVLVDLRVVKGVIPEPESLIQEHIDLVIPESFLDLPAIRKLVDLLLSDEFWMFMETQKGCDVSQRGLLE